MKRIFGTKKEKPPPPTIDEATAKLDTRWSTVDEKINKLDAQLAQFRAQIKKTRPGPAQEAVKRRALQVLKQKRMYEGQREQLYQQQFNLEQAGFTVQSAKDSVETVQALKAATKEVKHVFKSKELDMSAIDKLQDEMADLMDYNTELQEALGRSYAVPDDIDEEELMGELDALDAELALEAETGNAEGVPSYLQEPELPDAPVRPAQPAESARVPVDTFGLPAAPHGS